MIFIVRKSYGSVKSLDHPHEVLIVTHEHFLLRLRWTSSTQESLNTGVHEQPTYSQLTSSSSIITHILSLPVHKYVQILSQYSMHTIDVSHSCSRVRVCSATYPYQTAPISFQLCKRQSNVCLCCHRAVLVISQVFLMFLASMNFVFLIVSFSFSNP